MKINSLLSVIVCLIWSCTSMAQSSITIEASQNITNFKFINSLGEQDKNYSVNYSGGYALGYKYNLENGMYFPLKVGMRSAGASYVYDDANYTWSLQYFEARIGMGYNYKFEKLGVHFSATGYYGYLLKANQRLNNEDFDIRNSGEITKSDLGVFFSPGVNYQANDFINVYLDLNYMLGLGNLETDPDQKSTNYLFGGTLGLAFSIK